MEGLSFDNILGENEIENLFMDDTESSEKSEVSEDTSDVEEKNTDTDKTTEVVDPEDLFEEEEEKQPESVGSEKTEEEKGDSSTDDGGGTSPNENFYSSIANAMAEDGIFPNLDEETIKKATTAEGLSDLIEAEVVARLDEKQQRISRALEDGVEPSDIKKYEGALNYLSKITEQQLSEESDRGEQLRKNLIYQDFLNKGMSPEKAQKLTERSVDAGNDIEDAKEALQSNREFFQSEYNTLLKDAEVEAEENRAEQRKQAEKLKDSIMKDKVILGDIDVSQDLRKKTLDTITKPVYRDPDTGEYLTALQKYQMENRADFLKYVGLFMTLTNGFKDFDSFVKGKVKKEAKKGLARLEQTLNNTHRDSSGKLDLVTGVSKDPESFINQGFKLDL